MTEQEVRALGLPQLEAGLAMSAMCAQMIRKEVLETLLADAGDDPAARAAVIGTCKSHREARWWLLHRRGYGVAAAVHWAATLGEEVNQTSGGRGFPVA